MNMRTSERFWEYACRVVETAQSPAFVIPFPDPDEDYQIYLEFGKYNKSVEPELPYYETLAMYLLFISHYFESIGD